MSKKIISLSHNLFRRTSLLPVLAVIFLSGCESYVALTPKANYSFVNPNMDITTIGRIAVVELKNDSTYPQASSDITGALFQALQKKQVFGLISEGEIDGLVI